MRHFNASPVTGTEANAWFSDRRDFLIDELDISSDRISFTRADYVMSDAMSLYIRLIRHFKNTGAPRWLAWYEKTHGPISDPPWATWMTPTFALPGSARGAITYRPPGAGPT